MDLYEQLGYDVWNLVDHKEYSLLTNNDVTHNDMTHTEIWSESLLSAEDDEVTRYLSAYYPNPKQVASYLKTVKVPNSVPPPAPKQVSLPTATTHVSLSIKTTIKPTTKVITKRVSSKPTSASKRVSSKPTFKQAAKRVSSRTPSCKRKIDIDDLMEASDTSVVEFGFKRRKKKSAPQWVLPVLCRVWIGDGKDAQRRQKVLKVLLAHPNVSLSLSDLANKVGILLNTLSAAFSVNRMTKYLTEAPFASHKKGVVYRSVVNRQAMFLFKPT